MKSTAPPELIWLNQLLENCPISGEPLYAEEVEVVLTGEDPIVVDWTLGRSEHGNRWYGLIEDLITVLAEEDVPLGTVDGFLIDGEAAQSGFWMEGPVAQVLPWEVLRERLGQYLAEPTGPPPTPEEVRALPPMGGHWELGVQIAAWILNEDGERTPSYIALVIDPASGIRQHDLRPETPHPAADLANLICEAAARPRAGTPGRPSEVWIADEALAQQLAEALAPTPISVRAAPTPLADEVVADMIQTMRGGDDEPFFATQEAKAVRAYFKAAIAFYRIRPWDRLDGDKYIAFRLNDEPWFYLNVMGQMGEEFGLSLFDDWLQLCQFVHNQPTPWDYMMGIGEEKAFAAAGALEGLTLEPLHDLHPQDADYLQELGVKPVSKELYPLVRRFSLEGLEPPRHTLFVYQALMEALTDILTKRRTPRITSIKKTVDVGEASVTLRYPARGDEAFEEQPTGSFRLVVSGLEEGETERFEMTRIEIDVPGQARVDDVVRAIRREVDDDFWVNAINAGEHALWDYTMGRGAPCPRVVHLAPFSDLALSIYMEPYPIQVMPRMGAEVSEIQVRVVGR